VVEDLIGTLVRGNLRVRDFHANVDALLFGIAFDPVQYGDRIVGTFFPGHAAPFAGKRNESGASNAGAHVDTGTSGRFDLVVDFFADQSILETGSGAGHQGWRQAILREDRHLLGGGQIRV